MFHTRSGSDSVKQSQDILSKLENTDHVEDSCCLDTNDNQSIEESIHEKSDSLESDNQTSESSTNSKNADPVDDSGDKLQNSSIENEEARRSGRIRDRPKISYRLMEKYLLNAYVCFIDIPSTFEEIKHRRNRVF